MPVPPTRHHLLAAISSPPSTHRNPLTAIYSPPSARHHPLTAIHPPRSTRHHLLAAIYSPPTTRRHLLAAIYSPPSTRRHRTCRHPAHRYRTCRVVSQNFPLLLIHDNIRVWTSTMSATVPTYGAETAALGCLGYCQVASELRRFRLKRLVCLAQPDAQDDNFFPDGPMEIFFCLIILAFRPCT
jgi:hypothetical protein